MHRPPSQTAGVDLGISFLYIARVWLWNLMFIGFNPTYIYHVSIPYPELRGCFFIFCRGDIFAEIKKHRDQWRMPVWYGFHLLQMTDIVAGKVFVFLGSFPKRSFAGLQISIRQEEIDQW